jgi:alpha-beta hydrolase superfamily lysophospholipase
MMVSGDTLRETCEAVIAPDGTRMHLRRWSRAPLPCGNLVAVHGIGGHGGGFAGLACALADRGWQVWAPDLPGHGLSPGPRGWVHHWSVLPAALAAVLAHVCCATKGQPPPLLLGHSLGGAMALDLVLDGPPAAAVPAALVLSNPALDAEGIAAWRVQAARLLSRLWPRLSLDTGIDMALSCRDPLALERYRSDPLRHSRCSVRLGAGFLEAAARIRRRAPELRLPLLVLQSGDDRVTGPAAAQRFFAAAGSADKTFRLYPESRHELFDDLDRAAVIADLLAWLNTHRLSTHGA